MKTIFAGLEDSGKSLQLAMTVTELVERNAKWLAITGKPREIVSNLEFKDEFLNWATIEKGVPVRYWKDLAELPELTECDLIVDEVGTYFDSRSFKDLPLEIRLWLAQASKLGVDIYGSAQDFAQVDISFRRLTNQLYHITKLAGSHRPSATRPPVKRIWGICTVRELDPVAYDEDSKKFSNKGMFPSFFFIQKKYTDIFDTQKRIAKSAPPPYKHIERKCSDPKCNFELYAFRDGHKHKVTHV